MPPFLETARAASFGGLAFPWRTISIRASQRVGMHEYAYLDGADLEKLSRRPYQITIASTWDENLEDQYPDNLTRTLPALQRMFNNKTTEQLVLPRMGSLQAFFADYKEDLEATNASGVATQFAFIEENGLTLPGLTSSSTGFDMLVADMTALNRYRAELAAAGKDQVPSSLWDQLSAAVNSLVDLKNRGDLYAARAEQRLLSVSQLVRRIDSVITEPVGYQVIDALRILWADARKLVQDTTLTSNKLATYVVQRRMTIGGVSIAIYGTTSRSVEIMQLNALEDAMDILPGTKIRHYVPTLKVAA